MSNILYLTRSEIKPLASMTEVLDWVEEGFSLYEKSEIGENPASFAPLAAFRTRIPHSDIDYRAGTIDPIPVICTTIGFGYWDNPRKHGLPSVFAVDILADLETGVPLAIMDGFHLSFIRTGAAAAVASKYLAREDPKVLGFIGAGSLARFTLEAHIEAFGSFKEVIAWGRTLSHTEKFAAEMEEAFKVPVKAVDNPMDAVKDSDIVCCCTPSRDPIVMKEWVSPGMHLNAFGADAPGKQELDPFILTQSKIVVDSLKQCKIGGEIHKPLADGVIREEDIYGSIGEIINHKKKGRENDEEITLMDSTGVNALDVVTCHRVYEKALSKGLGTKLELFWK